MLFAFLLREGTREKVCDYRIVRSVPSTLIIVHCEPTEWMRWDLNSLGVPFTKSSSLPGDFSVHFFLIFTDTNR